MILWQSSFGDEIRVHCFYERAPPAVALRKRDQRLAEPISHRKQVISITDIGSNAVALAYSLVDEVQHHERVTRTLGHLRNAIDEIRQRAQARRCFKGCEKIGLLEHIRNLAQAGLM